MKTIFKFIAAFSMVMAFAACNKENNIDSAASGRKIVLTVNDNITKTAYAPGTGVKLTGTENIGLFYRFNEGEQTGRWNGMATTGQAKPVIATPSAGQYTFSIPAGAQYTEWTGILPYSSQNTFTDTQGIQMVVKLSSVQCPGQNTFDPAYDYLLAKNFEINEGDGTAEITEFKRIFAPLRLTLTGIPAENKVYAVTFESNQLPYVPGEGEWPFLVGQFNVNCSGEASQAKIVSVEYEKKDGQPTNNIAFGNAVSAVYSEGLSSLDGSFPVWFMVNPSFVFNEDSKVTVTVNTDNGQIVRTITIPEEIELSADKLNGITVNMAGAGAVKETRTVLTQVFSNVTKLSDATASDNKKYNWTGAALWNVNDNNRDAGSLLKNALNFTNRPDAAIPAVTGYKIEKIRLYAHPVTNAKYAVNSYLSLKDGEGELAQIPFNFCSTDPEKQECLYSTGGVVDIECPDGVDNLAGLKLVGTNNCLASAVAFYVVEDKKEYEEATGNDLWSEFQAGKKITINGVEYTKEAYPAAKLLELSSTTTALDAGVFFVSGSVVSAAKNNLGISKGDVVLINRYQDAPASLTFNQVKFGGTTTSVVFHGLKFGSHNSSATFVNNNNPTSDVSLVLSKCNIDIPGGLVRCADATYCFNTVVIDNCNVKYNANSVYEVKTVSVNVPRLFVMKNSIINSGASTSAVYNLSTQQTPDLDIRITGNTFTLGSVTKFFNIKSCKSLTYENNTGYDGELGYDIE